MSPFQRSAPNNIRLPVDTAFAVSAGLFTFMYGKIKFLITSYVSLLARRFYGYIVKPSLISRCTYSEEGRKEVRHMNDVQKAAQERAAKPGKPIGSSFETERQREKRAVFKQIEGSSGANIHKIAATASAPEGDENKPLRVAAYCRVSTDDLDQAVSIALQIADPRDRRRDQGSALHRGRRNDPDRYPHRRVSRQSIRRIL